MNAAATQWAIEQIGLPATTKMILVFLAQDSDLSGSGVIYRATLAGRCQISSCALDGHLTALTSKRYMRTAASYQPGAKPPDEAAYQLVFSAPQRFDEIVRARQADRLERIR